VLVYATPSTIDTARSSWLGNRRSIAIGDADDSARSIFRVAPQNFRGASMKKGLRPNHGGDNRPLAAIRIANQSNPLVLWLCVGDADTSWNVSALERALAVIDHRIPLFLAHPRSPSTPSSYCNSNRCCRSTTQPCKLNTSIRRDFYAPGMHRPNVWAFGGGGYILSRALLDAISVQQWRDCEEKMHNNGGDVRVSSCIFSHTGLVLTAHEGLLGSLSQHDTTFKNSIVKNETMKTGCLPPSSRAAFWRKQLLTNQDRWDTEHTSLIHQAQQLDSPVYGMNSLLDFADYGILYGNASVIEAPGAGEFGRLLAFVMGWTERQHKSALIKLLGILKRSNLPSSVIVNSDLGFPHPSIQDAVDDAIQKGIRFWAPNLEVARPGVSVIPRGVKMSGFNRVRIMTPDEERPRLLHCGAMSIRAGRLAKLVALRSNGFICPVKAPARQVMEEYRKSYFVFSPAGNGLQNHRDWEALASGAILLIDKYDDHDIFNGLPVVRVGNWSKVTSSFLMKKLAEIRSQTFIGYEKLLTKTWVEAVGKRCVDPNPNLFDGRRKAASKLPP